MNLNDITLTSNTQIFPADAGVNLTVREKFNLMNNIPRGCGGEPEQGNVENKEDVYSPRMRG